MSDAVTEAIQASIPQAEALSEMGNPAEPLSTESTPAADAAPAANTTAAPAAEAAPAETKPKTEEDEILEIERQLTKDNPSLERGQISRSRHQAMLTRRGREHEAAIAALKAEHEKALGQYQTQEFKENLAALDIVRNDPATFIQHFLLNDERYKTALSEHFKNEFAKAAPAEAVPAPALNIQRPEPDMLLPDGSAYYTPETLEKVVLHDVQKAVASIEEKWNKRFDGIDELTKVAKQHREHSEGLRQATDRQSRIFEDAKANWPRFTEPAIYEAIKAEVFKEGQTKGLEAIYREVMHRISTEELNKLRQDLEGSKSQTRADVIAEMNRNAPTASPRGGRVPGAVIKAESEDPIGDAIRKASAGLR